MGWPASRAASKGWWSWLLIYSWQILTSLNFQWPTNIYYSPLIYWIGMKQLELFTNLSSLSLRFPLENIHFNFRPPPPSTPHTPYLNKTIPIQININLRSFPSFPPLSLTSRKQRRRDAPQHNDDPPTLPWGHLDCWSLLLRIYIGDNMCYSPAPDKTRQCHRSRK